MPTKLSVLRTLDFDLGTCWIRALEEDKMKHFDWDENIYPVALLPVGYPDEALRQENA